MVVVKVDGNSPKRGGFTLIELLVVVSIIALLISILLPSLGKAKEAANKTVCGANLHDIMQSMLMYGGENADVYPCSSSNGGNNYTCGFVGTTASGSNDKDQLSISLSAQKGVVLDSLWMLVLRGEAAPKQFWCKSDSFLIGPAVTSNGSFYANFQDQYQISYSIEYPWQTSGINPNWHSTGMKYDSPVICDMAPLSGTNGKTPGATRGQASSKAFNSSNHDDRGQNIAFGDGHAEFCTDPFHGGSQMDNMFATNSGAIATLGQLPTSPAGTDFVMVPVRDTSSGDMGP